MVKQKKEEIIRTPAGEIHPKSLYVCGLDVARQGSDETAIVILEQLPFDTNIFICYIETLHTPDLRMAINRTIFLDSLFQFKKIIVDMTGLGAGVVDILKGEVGSRVEGIWYTQKSKAELFNNLKLLMARKDSRLFIPDWTKSTNPIVKKMFYQFLSIQQEWKDGDATRTPKISHESRSHDDIVNALALSASYWNVGRRIRKYPLGGIKH